MLQDGSSNPDEKYSHKAFFASLKEPTFYVCVVQLFLLPESMLDLFPYASNQLFAHRPLLRGWLCDCLKLLASDRRPHGLFDSEDKSLHGCAQHAFCHSPPSHCNLFRSTARGPSDFRLSNQSDTNLLSAIVFPSDLSISSRPSP